MKLKYFIFITLHLSIAVVAHAGGLCSKPCEASLETRLFRRCSTNAVRSGWQPSPSENDTTRRQSIYESAPHTPSPRNVLASPVRLSVVLASPVRLSVVLWEEYFVDILLVSQSSSVTLAMNSLELCSNDSCTLNDAVKKLTATLHDIGTHHRRATLAIYSQQSEFTIATMCAYLERQHQMSRSGAFRFMREHLPKFSSVEDRVACILDANL